MRTLLLSLMLTLTACGDKDEGSWGTVGGSGEGSGGDDGGGSDGFPDDLGYDFDGAWVPTTNGYFGEVFCGSANGMWATFGVGLPGVKGQSLEWGDVDMDDYVQVGLYFKEKPEPGEYLVREAGDYNRDDEPKELKREGVVIQVVVSPFADEPLERWEVPDEAGTIVVEERSDGTGASFLWGDLPIEIFGGGTESDTEGGHLDCLDW